MSTEQRRNQRFAPDGTLLSESVVTVDNTSEVNANTVRTRATAALTANATYLAIASPTNAQVAAQVRTLTKECNAVIRLLTGLLADVSDTA